MYINLFYLLLQHNRNQEIKESRNQGINKIFVYYIMKTYRRKSLQNRGTRKMRGGSPTQKYINNVKKINFLKPVIKQQIQNLDNITNSVNNSAKGVNLINNKKFRFKDKKHNDIMSSVLEDLKTIQSDLSNDIKIKKAELEEAIQQKDKYKVDKEKKEKTIYHKITSMFKR